MIKSANIIVYTLSLFPLATCQTGESAKFQMPNGQTIRQTTIQELEKERKIYYEQYRGFVLEYQDSLFNGPLLSIKNNIKIAGTDVLKDDAIDDLKENKVESLQFKYEVPNGSKQRDPGFEAVIRRKFTDYDTELKLQNGFTLYKNGRIYVELLFHNFGIPIYLVTVHPKK